MRAFSRTLLYGRTTVPGYFLLPGTPPPRGRPSGTRSCLQYRFTCGGGRSRDLAITIIIITIVSRVLSVCTRHCARAVLRVPLPAYVLIEPGVQVYVYILLLYTRYQYNIIQVYYKSTRVIHAVNNHVLDSHRRRRRRPLREVRLYIQSFFPFFFFGDNSNARQV